MTAEVIDFQVKRAQFDPKEAIRQSEEASMQRARKIAAEKGYVAHSAESFAKGWFAIPSVSQKQEGLRNPVHLGAINWTTGQPLFCSCPAYIKWCGHAGAMRLAWEQEREIDDETYRQMQIAQGEGEES